MNQLDLFDRQPEFTPQIMRSCSGCPHLFDRMHDNIWPPTPSYYCGHHDEMELDSNAPGRWLGFIPLVSEECQLLQRKEAVS